MMTVVPGYSSDLPHWAIAATMGATNVHRRIEPTPTLISSSKYVYVLCRVFVTPAYPPRHCTGTCANDMAPQTPPPAFSRPEALRT